tara:strand:- start:365 stop:943 length:579 start_codon:yes stop_codon:yes gene_type:complete
MLTNVQEELDRFAKYVISQARANLTRGSKPYGSKNSSRKLYDSLKSNVKVSKNSFELSFLMEQYGLFQDKGVKGKDPSKVSPNAKITGQQAPNSEYRFGSGNTGNYKDFVDSIEVWAKRKNIRLRDKKGKFTKGDYKTIARIIAGNIYNRGIKPSLFFTKPFEKAFDNIDKDLVKAYKLDIETLMKNSINNK